MTEDVRKKDKHVGWIASLNTGETVFERPPQEGDKYTAWRMFLERLLESNGELKVTQLRLQYGGVTLVCEPHAEGYVFCKEIYAASPMKKWYDKDGNRVSPPSKEYAGIGTVHGDQVNMMWIDASNTVKHDIRLFKDLKIHSTLTDVI
jgi:hypothetical protein